MNKFYACNSKKSTTFLREENAIKVYHDVSVSPLIFSGLSKREIWKCAKRSSTDNPNWNKNILSKYSQNTYCPDVVLGPFMGLGENNPKYIWKLCFATQNDHYFLESSNLRLFCDST